MRKTDSRQERLWKVTVQVSMRLDPTEHETASFPAYRTSETVYVDGSRDYAQRVVHSLATGATKKQRYVEGSGD